MPLIGFAPPALNAASRGPGLPLPDADEAHLWSAQLDLPPDALLHLAARLDGAERARAAALAAPRERIRYAAAHGIVRELLGSYLGLDPAAVKVVTGRHGKPDLDATQNGRVLRFNLSHSDSGLLAAFTRDHPVGVDLERLRPVCGHQRLARRLPPDTSGMLFLRRWVRHEALIKAAGGSLLGGVPESAEDWSLHEPHVGPGYVAALAVAHPGPVRVVLRGWDPGVLRRYPVYQVRGQRVLKRERGDELKGGTP